MLEFHPADVCRLRAARVFLNAFDMIELEGEYIRRDPLAVRKVSLLSRAAPGLRCNEHMDEADDPLVFAHACKMGFEGHRIEAARFARTTQGAHLARYVGSSGRGDG
jgi:hypothetical protein